jgi:N-formylglutamate amidohydrolase
MKLIDVLDGVVTPKNVLIEAQNVEELQENQAISWCYHTRFDGCWCARVYGLNNTTY